MRSPVCLLYRQTSQNRKRRLESGSLGAAERLSCTKQEKWDYNHGTLAKPDCFRKRDKDECPVGAKERCQSGNGRSGDRQPSDMSQEIGHLSGIMACLSKAIAPLC